MIKISEIIKNHKAAVFPKIGFHEQRVLSKIQICRTEELGAHLYLCDDCQTTLLLNNSCGNGNCPICQANKRKIWIEKQCQNLVNVPYFHVVFTVPDVLNSMFLANQALFYNILYHSSWETLKKFFENDTNLLGKGGMICILHTWGQNLGFHPHLHCLVPAAGISENGDSKLVKGKDKFLFDVKNMGKVFRAKFAEKITKAQRKLELKFPEIIRKLMFEKNWVVFAQKPFSTPENVVRYIGMYSHRVAISENRILDDKDGIVTFKYKDYKDNGNQKVMALASTEFVRRFAMHILPSKFVKIRYYGMLINRCKKQFLETAEKTVGLYLKQEDLNTINQADNDEILDINFEVEYEKQEKNKQKISCPHCKKGNLRRLANFSKEILLKGLVVKDCKSNKVLYQSRDGPATDFVIFEINI